MAIFKRLTKEQIKKNFKYKALAYGVIPVYFSDLEDPYPIVVVRNWVPDWTLEVASYVYFLFFDLVDPYHLQERAFPFTITGKIK